MVLTAGVRHARSLVDPSARPDTRGRASDARSPFAMAASTADEMRDSGFAKRCKMVDEDGDPVASAATYGKLYGYFSVDVAAAMGAQRSSTSQPPQKKSAARTHLRRCAPPSQ